MNDTIETLAAKRNELKRQVIEWMNNEGSEGRLRQNSQAPMWADYEDAETALQKALNAVPETPPSHSISTHKGPE